MRDGTYAIPLNHRTVCLGVERSSCQVARGRGADRERSDRRRGEWPATRTLTSSLGPATMFPKILPAAPNSVPRSMLKGAPRCFDMRRRAGPLRLEPGRVVGLCRGPAPRRVRTACPAHRRATRGYCELLRSSRDRNCRGEPERPSEKLWANCNCKDSVLFCVRLP
jgi:hypothetical protein